MRLSLPKILTINCEEFRKVAQSASNAAGLTERHDADFIAAFGCDSLPISARDSRIQDTALRTMSGAGHQHFIGSMRELGESTKSDHLRASLFEVWQYSDPKPSLRWILWTTAGMLCVGRNLRAIQCVQCAVPIVSP